MKKSQILFNSWKVFVFSIAAIVHIIIILTVSIKSGEKEERKDTTLFKMVDVKEYVTPPPVKVLPKKVIPKEKVIIPIQDDVADVIVETKKEVVEIEEDEVEIVDVVEEVVIDYLPQHKISVPPGIPTKEILSRIIYPPLANRQKIEGVVYLELYIDNTGVIRDINILRDPGFGLAEAAVIAITGLVCSPAEANGLPVAVRFRYPVRFKLK